jgi:phosphate transport system permease protein
LFVSSTLSPLAFLKRRHRREFLLRGLGQLMIGGSLCILAFLLGSILKNGYTAFFQTQLSIPLHPNVMKQPLHRLSREALLPLVLTQGFPFLQTPAEQALLQSLTSWGADRKLRTHLKKERFPPGEASEIWIPVHSDLDQFYKAFLGLRPLFTERFSAEERWMFQILLERQSLHLAWNADFLTRGDSQEPELAGLRGAFMGSFYTLLVALLIAFPLGVGAGIYLEEFAPRNRFTHWAELHINNLAAVPSILFGLLGLIIFDKLFQFPRPSSLLGGATLALMMCPPLIVITRLSLRAVPAILREAAYALGASTVQVVFHQIFPIAFSAILSGTMMVIARILGESAPLLMVGMVAFIADVPQTLTDPATVLPIQIFSWAKNSHVGFLEKTSGAILGLFIFLIFLNALALFIRRHMERKLAP